MYHNHPSKLGFILTTPTTIVGALIINVDYAHANLMHYNWKLLNRKNTVLKQD